MDSNTIEQLLEAQACSHPDRETVLRETHISWVILAGDFAYKIKKPVDFGFLDFSTLALREHFCEQELRLNSRFAPELYLEVVAITAGPQGPQIDGDGAVIDYAVKMRRFDEAHLLDNIARRGELDRELLRALGLELARLHGALPPQSPSPDSDEPGTPVALQQAITQNFRQVREYPLAREELDQLEAVEHWSQRSYAQLLPVMTQRASAGWVIDGHGDAHLGNIALVDGSVRLFDCIEFNASFRIMDSIAEIAFLTMDMDARGYHAHAHCLLCDYLEYRGDYGGLALLDLYRSYFAMVRAKVALLRISPGDEAVTTSAAYREFRRYLLLAYRYGQARQAFLAITHGVSGSGKSTIADKLVAAGGAIRIRSDVERKRLFGLAPEQRSKAADNEELYSTRMSRRTFDRLEELTRLSVEAGFAVIVDATFLHRRVRDTFRHLAHDLQVPFVIIDCIAGPAQLRQRLIERECRGRDASEADVAVMESQLKTDQPPGDAELACRMAADSSEDGPLLWQRLLQQCGA